MKNWIINGSLAFGSVCLFFGGIEAALRLTGIVQMKDYTPPIYEKSENPKISYRLKQNIKERAFRNTVTTNSLGFRTNGDASSSCFVSSPDTKPSAQHDTCKPLIALVGDSITFGYGVADDQTLAANLQKLLPAYDVQNAGVPGYNVGQESALYKEKIAPLNPEALVLIFYWHDEDLRTSFLDEENVLRPEGWMPSTRACQPISRGILAFVPGQCFLDSHSAFFRGLKEYVNTRSAFRERDRLREEEPEAPSVEIQEFDLPTYERELKNLARTAPQKRLFVIWPDAADLRIEERSQLRRIAQEQGFIILDLTEHFGNSLETLSWDYIHPNAESLSKAATIIYDVLNPLLKE